MATHIYGFDVMTSKGNAKALGKFKDIREEVEDVVKTGSFKCSLCYKDFQSFLRLCNHKKAYHAKTDTSPQKIGGASKYICSVVHCTERFNNAKKLEDHQKLHGSFNCDFCDEIKEYAPDLAIHESMHATRAESSGKKFNCSRCEYSSARESWYLRHLLDVHLNLNATTEICSICGAEGNGNGFISRHFKRYHRVDDPDQSDIHKCDYDQCSAYFRERNHWNQLCQHKYKMHFNEKCPECGKATPEWTLLLAHMNSKHPNHNAFPIQMYMCKVGTCRRKFDTEVELKEHTKSYSHVQQDKGNLMCSKCGKEYKGNAGLYLHMQTVHSARSHICQECGKMFKTKLTLSLHLEYHKSPDDWQFQCPTCGRKFADKQKLEQHSRTHTKEKPFICQFCGERYAHRRNLKNHMRTKHKDEYKEPQAVSKMKGNFLSRKGSKKGDCITACRAGTHGNLE